MFDNTNELLGGFDIQPDFPSEDLTDNNADMLKYCLTDEAGIDSYALELTRAQRSFYKIAHQALRQMNIRASYDPQGLRAFSQGFTGLEAMADIVHPTEQLIYPIDNAVARVSNDYVDTRSEDERRTEQEFYNLVGDDEERDIPDNLTGDGIRLRYYETDQGILDLPPTLTDSVIRQYREQRKLEGNNRADAPKKIGSYMMKLLQTHPNIVDVMTHVGSARSETMALTYSRLAGVAVAHSLQVRD